MARASLLSVVGTIAVLLTMQSGRADPLFDATNQTPPPGWTGPVFQPSFSFPSSFTPETLPWSAIDFHTEVGARQYMQAVKDYIFEGMDLQTWDAGSNPVRKWYHVPWMHTGPKGREFIHGLTKERSSRRMELGPNQNRCVQNWAVGFYNPAGGTVLQAVWGDGTKPPVKNAVQFPVGTVVAKLLFTEATPEEVPLLAGAPEWDANIYVGTDVDNRGCVREDPTTNPFQPVRMRLLQFDIAVRDANAELTGWIFGTFVYNGGNESSSAWDRLEPVGLMWGNDPDLSDAQAQAGENPKEGIVLGTFGFNRDFGRSGRMNGPVDNPISACLSCHMTAIYPAATPLAPTSSDWSDAKCWFRNLRPDEAFGKPPPHCGDPVQKEISLDFSLQLRSALSAYDSAQARGGPEASVAKGSPAIVDGVLVFPTSREGF